MTRLPLLAASIALVIAAPALQAQANLSTQGLGYAPAQMSARAKTTGGALGEIDPASSINPAALLNWGGAALFFQVEPEYRSVDFGGVKDRTNIARYPLFSGALPFGSKLIFGVTSSTLLDRTWATTDSTTNVIAGETVSSTTALTSAGGINDLRAAIGYAVRPWLFVGVAGHAFTGRHQLTTLRVFADSSLLTPFRDTTYSSYGGNAVSAGVEARAGRIASFAASYRHGLGISAQTGGAERSATVPNRLGLSVAYLGIAGTTIAARASHEAWSSLEGLSLGASRPRDAWDFGLGADAVGPRIGGRTVQLRGGLRQRTLPYEALGESVRERSFSGGFGTLLGRGRAVLDVGVIRSHRDATGGGATAASERAWTFSAALTVRP